MCNHEVRTPKSESRSAFKLPAVVQRYGSPKKITRAAFLARKKIEQDIVETDQLAKPYYRWHGKVYKQVSLLQVLCIHKKGIFHK